MAGSEADDIGQAPDNVLDSSRYECSDDDGKHQLSLCVVYSPLPIGAAAQLPTQGCTQKIAARSRAHRLTFP